MPGLDVWCQLSVIFVRQRYPGGQGLLELVQRRTGVEPHTQKLKEDAFLT